MSLVYGGGLWRTLKPTPGSNAKEEEEEEFGWSTWREEATWMDGKIILEWFLGK
jgi:hypothetical protein